MSAALAIKPLLDHATDKLIQLKITSITPVRIIGTEQLRFLNKNAREALYAVLQKYIAEHYKNVLVVTGCETVSGKMKALYSWLTVNYLEKHFQNGTPTFGAIYSSDISLDVAFVVPKSVKPIDEINVKINDKNYIVFTKSFLELGLQHIHENILADDYAKYCYPKESIMPNDEDGDFNLISCGEIYQEIFKKAKITEKIAPTFRIPQFIAFGEVAKTYHFFGGNKDLDKESFEQEILTPQCNNVWGTLKDAYGFETPNALLQYCSNGVYFSNLFFNQLQLRAEQLKVVSHIHDENIHWPLGAAIYSFIN
jgi:hypothetical protein